MRNLIVSFFFVSCASVSTKTIIRPEQRVFPNFVLISSTESQGVKTFQFKNDTNQNIFLVVLMKDLKPNEAARLAQSHRNYLQSLFQSDEDPYFAKSSRSQACLHEIQLDGTLQDDNVSSFSAYVLPSTDHFVLGLCNPKLEDWIASFEFIYCKTSGNFLEVKYYRPNTQKEIPIFNHEAICEHY